MFPAFTLVRVKIDAFLTAIGHFSIKIAIMLVLKTTNEILGSDKPIKNLLQLRIADIEIILDIASSPDRIAELDDSPVLKIILRTALKLIRDIKIYKLNAILIPAIIRILLDNIRNISPDDIKDRIDILLRARNTNCYHRIRAPLFLCRSRTIRNHRRSSGRHLSDNDT